MTPADTKDPDFLAIAEETVREQPLAVAVIALLLGFIVGQCLGNAFLIGESEAAARAGAQARTTQ